jgi:maltose O-acetyltransferase
MSLLTVLRRLFADVMINSVIGARIWPRSFRPHLLRMAHVRIGPNSRIGSHCSFIAGRSLTLGPRTFVNTECLFNVRSPITIGADVFLANRVSLLTTTHEIGPSERRAGTTISKPIVIEDGCWIAAGAIVLPGVTIRQGCIVAAGAVVNADCDPDGLYAGVPARRVRDLDAAGR